MLIHSSMHTSSSTDTYKNKYTQSWAYICYIEIIYQYILYISICLCTHTHTSVSMFMYVFTSTNTLCTCYLFCSQSFKNLNETKSLILRCHQKAWINKIWKIISMCVLCVSKSLKRKWTQTFKKIKILKSFL